MCDHFKRKRGSLLSSPLMLLSSHEYMILKQHCKLTKRVELTSCKVELIAHGLLWHGLLERFYVSVSVPRYWRQACVDDNFIKYLDILKIMIFVTYHAYFYASTTIWSLLQFGGTWDPKMGEKGMFKLCMKFNSVVGTHLMT